MTPPDHDDAASVEKHVRASLVAQYAQALLVLVVLLIPGAVAWIVTFTSMRAEVAAKASQAEVDAVRRTQESQGLTLKVLERRQLLMYCAQFPQSFECQPSERRAAP